MVQMPYLQEFMLDAISSSLQVFNSAKVCSGSSCDGAETAETKATSMEELITGPNVAMRAARDSDPNSARS